MGGHSPTSNGPESPDSPRRSPSPPSKGAAPEKSMAEKPTTEGASSKDAVDAGSIGKVEQSKSHPRGVGGGTAAHNGAIVFHHAGAEEPENAEVASAVQDSAEYSPPRVYYRSFRDQGEFVYGGNFVFCVRITA